MAQRSLVVNFVGDTAALEKSFARVGTGLNGIEAAGKRASSAGTSLTRGLTVPIIGLAVASGKMASDFQSAMERLHTQAGVSQKAVGALSTGVLNLAGQVGESPNTLALGMYHVASSLNATLQPAKRSSTELRVLKIAAEGARIGNADLVDVTNALDAAIVSGIKGVQNYGQAMGALNAIVGAGDMTMQDLADALSTGLLAPMKTYGLTLKDVGGALAVFGDSNIRGQDAATKLISAVRIMAAPSKAAAKELGTVGLSTLQLANDMRKGGIVLALTDLKKHLDDAGLTASQQALVIARAFGGRQSTGVQILLGQLERLRVKTHEVGAGAAGFGKAWSATQLTASQKTKEALGKMEADLTKFGTVALPTLLSAGSTIVHDVDKVAHAFSSLPKGAQDAIITGGLITAGIGPALKLVGLVTGLVGKSWVLLRAAAALGGIGKGASLLGGKSLTQSVGTMQVGTLIAKSTIGGSGPGGAATSAEKKAAEKQAAKSTEKTILSDAEKIAVGGASAGGGATLLARGGSLLSKLPGGVVAGAGAAAGVGLLFGSATAIRGLIGSPPSQEQILQAIGLMRPTPGHGPLPGERGAPPGLPEAVARGQAVPPQIELPTVYKDAELALGALGHLDKVTHGWFGYLAWAAGKANDIKWKFADTLASDVLKGQKIGSKGVTDLIGSLNRLKPGARSAAANSMIEMAQQLELRGKLPAGAADRLRAQIIGSYASMRKGATREYSRMAQEIAATTRKAAADIESGYPPAITAANTAFHGFASNVQAAMSAGTIAVGTGTQLIASTLIKVLKAIGVKAPSAQLAQVDTAKLTAGLSSGTISLSQAQIYLSSGNTRARGGLVQFGRAGDKGHDAIPVNMGGIPLLVGSGEIGAVFTGQQQADINAKLADEGGLHGFFAKRRRPHHMAGGGVVAGSEGAVGTMVRGALGLTISAASQNIRSLMPHGRRGMARGGIPHERFDPFTGQYEMLTASQEAALRDRYIREYGHPYRTPKTPKAPKGPTAAQIRARQRAEEAARLAPYAVIPSQTTIDQIEKVTLENAGASALNSGNTVAQQAALTRELTLEKRFLMADKRQLERVNKILASHRLTRAEQTKVLEDKLAQLQEIGAVTGDIGSTQSALANLTSAASAGGFDLAPTGASIASPTVYDVRTAIARGSHLHLHVHAPINVTHAHDGEVIKRIVTDSVKEMGEKIDRAAKGHLHARMRATGLRGS